LEAQKLVKVLEKQIEKVIQLSEAAVIEMSQASESGIEIVKESKEEITASLQEVEKLNQKSVGDLNYIAAENSQVLAETEEYLKSVIKEFEDLFELWEEDSQRQIVQILEEVNRKTRVVALNATIEAARLGQAGESFAVVAKEIQKLVDQTSGAIAKLVTQNRFLQEKVKNMDERLTLMESLFLEKLKNIESLVKESSKIGEEWGKTTAKIFAKTEASLENLSKVISAEVVNFQFQDLIAQRLNNVIQGLKLIEEYLEKGEQKELLQRIEQHYTSEEEREIHYQAVNNKNIEKKAYSAGEIEFF